GTGNTVADDMAPVRVALVTGQLGLEVSGTGRALRHPGSRFGYVAASVRAFIGLGGNLGEPATAFRAAVSELRAIGQVVRVSSLYDRPPRDAFDQQHFLNAALELITDLEPIELLTELKRLELALGRDPEG